MPRKTSKATAKKAKAPARAAKAPAKGTKAPAKAEHATVAHVIGALEHMERHSRLMRLMLKQLDPKTPIKMTPEIKGLLKAAPMPWGTSTC